MKTWLAGLVVLLLGASAEAHVASSGFLDVDVTDSKIDGSIELAIRDVELAVGVDNNRDGKVTWSELQANESSLQRYVADHLTFSTGQAACATQFQRLQVNTRVDGAYAWLPFTSQCTGVIDSLRIQYSLLRTEDPSHRGLLRLRANGMVQTAVLGGDVESPAFSTHGVSRWRTFQEYLTAGIWHIWSGIDHLLFLISLLLPSVLWRRGKHWEPVQSAQPALLSILKVVTAFTLAHSITLSLAALDIVRLPTRLTESVIAASIVVAALNNIFPVVTESRARIAFSFGLLHGFGFASVLADMGLPPGARLLSLIGFNAGIECGQLAVVLAVMPVVYAFRRQLLYRQTILPLGSAAIAVLAGFWCLQRMLGW